MNLIICLIVAGATEVTSNTATATLLMPILAELVCTMFTYISVEFCNLYSATKASVHFIFCDYHQGFIHTFGIKIKTVTVYTENLILSRSRFWTR